MRAPALIRGGWWVVAAAAIVSAVMVVLLVAPGSWTRRSNVGIANGFDVSEIGDPTSGVTVAMQRDGLPVIDDPIVIGTRDVEARNREQRGKLLVPRDRVVGVTFAGEARAYPLRVMRWHEVVNDVIGGQPIAVTYSPLCDSVVVFDRRLTSEQTVELGVSGLLIDSNPLLYDRRVDPQSSPLWRQLDGARVVDRASGRGQGLQPIVADLTTWERWCETHPDTTVLAPLPNLRRMYRRDPYHSYFGSDLLRFPVDPLPPEGGLHLKDRVVIVTVDGRDAAFAMPHLVAAAGTEAGSLAVRVLDVDLEIRFRADPGVATVTAITEPQRLTAVRYTFWFSWYALMGPHLEKIATGPGEPR